MERYKNRKLQFFENESKDLTQDEILKRAAKLADKRPCPHCGNMTHQDNFYNGVCISCYGKIMGVEYNEEKYAAGSALSSEHKLDFRDKNKNYIYENFFKYL